jgi:hypothetical protein
MKSDWMCAYLWFYELLYVALCFGEQQFIIALIFDLYSFKNIKYQGMCHNHSNPLHQREKFLK